MDKKKVSIFLDNCVELIYGNKDWLEFNKLVKSDIREWHKGNYIEGTKEIPTEVYDIVTLRAKRMFRGSIQMMMINNFIKDSKKKYCQEKR